MRRILIIIVVIAAILGILLMVGARLIEKQIQARLPDWADQITTSDFRLFWDSIEKGDCLFQACVRVKNLRLAIGQSISVPIGDVDCTIPVHWPVRVSLTTQENDPMHVSATLSRYRWDIRQLQGQIDDLSFQIAGVVDGRTEEGELMMRTTGLRSFIKRYFMVPAWLNLLLTDAAITLTLTPKDGALRLMGIPIVPFN